MLTQYTTLSFCTKQTQSLYDDYDVLCTTSAAEPAQRRHSGRATACRKTKWTGRYNAIATADSRPCVRGSDTQHTPCSSEKTKSTPHAGHPANISADRSADGERRSLAKYYDVFGPTCQQRLFRNQHWLPASRRFHVVWPFRRRIDTWLLVFWLSRKFFRWRMIPVFTARRYASTVYAVVVCPSVSLSHAGIVSKWLNVESRKQRHTIA